MTLFKLNNLLRKQLSAFHYTNVIRRSFSTTNDQIERQFDEININSFKELITNEKIKNKIELIISEYEYEKYTTLRVPTTLTTNHMKELLSLEEPKDRNRSFNFYFLKEIKKIKSKTKREEHSNKYWTEKNEIYSKLNSERTGIWDNNHQLIYGLWHNTLFSKISNSSVSSLYNNRLRRAALFGQKLVIDLDFDKYMKFYEKRLLLKQIRLLYNYNKYKTEEPFDLHFTNCDKNTVLMQEMSKLFPNMNSPKFMASFHSQSYIDLFPKHQLIYLSPHSRHTLQEVNEDFIYIIGGIVDKSCREPITYINAQKAGIRSARLPIDENLLWKGGSKTLCLNHLVAILHDYKISGDWRRALSQNVPQRHQKTIEEIRLEDELRELKYKRFSKKDSLKKSYQKSYQNSV